MKLAREMRDVMLSQVSAALLDPDPQVDKKIKFYDGSTLLCELTYLTIVPEGSGEVRMIKFKSPDNTYVLRATAIGSGRVSSFTISGKPAGEDVKTSMISGTVGPLGSTADIKFNRIDWSANTTITLSNLSIVSLQGS